MDSETPAAKAEKDPTAKGLNQSGGDGSGVKGGAVGDVAERSDGEPAEHQQLESHQHVLDGLGGFHAAVGDPAREGNEHQRRGDVQRQVRGEVGEFRVADELRQHQVEEVHRDGGQVREHDDGRGNQSPAAHPANPRAERPRGPGEGGAGVGHGVVQLAVAERHQQHRDEAHQEDRRQVHADLGDGGAQGRREGVGRGDAGNADDDGANQPHRSCLQALLAQPVLIVRCPGPAAVRGCEAWDIACSVLIIVPLGDVSFDAEWLSCLSS